MNANERPATRDLAEAETGRDGDPGLRGTGAADEPMARQPQDERAAAAGRPREPLFRDEQLTRLRDRWQTIQTTFVDEPRESVRQADALVADLMRELAAGFADERERLERQWDGGDDASTEDLRVALTRYRSFFERLLDA